MKELRGRLFDLSWFMKLLCEHVARKANKEEGVRGKFWESRFLSVPLLDEEALVACSMYVDLNPIRAVTGDRPETSPYTSAYERIQALRRRSSGEFGSQSPTYGPPSAARSPRGR
jgi:hypothetical protein